MLNKTVELIQKSARKIADMDKEELKTIVMIVSAVIFVNAVSDLGRRINNTGVK
jgi:hypothetical protein